MQNKDKGDGIEDSPLDMLLVILLGGASKEVVTPSSNMELISQYHPTPKYENQQHNTQWKHNFGSSKSHISLCKIVKVYQNFSSFKNQFHKMMRKVFWVAWYLVPKFLGQKSSSRSIHQTRPKVNAIFTQNNKNKKTSS